jgi:hypothetical protein
MHYKVKKSPTDRTSLKRLGYPIKHHKDQLNQFWCETFIPVELMVDFSLIAIPNIPHNVIFGRIITKLINIG